MKKTIKIYGYHDRVKKAIDASGMTGSEVAKKCGFKRNAFCASRISQMNSGHLMRFCAVVGCSADYILGLKREMK
jgi:hypothetical protein